MRIRVLCPSCDLAAGEFSVELLPKNDCAYELECPHGHRIRANVLYHQFQKLYEVAINALADDYYREAVGAFAASYERFLELFIRIVMRTNGVESKELASGWKTISKKSERQLGAFVFLFIQEFGLQPPLLTNKLVELRNNVTHQGYFPTKEESLNFGGAVLDSIRQTIRLLYESPKHQPELIRSINDQGDFSESGPNLHCFAYTLIQTNSPPDYNTKTVEEMLENAHRTRR